jgi:hypothetical protein
MISRAGAPTRSRRGGSEQATDRDVLLLPRRVDLQVPRVEVV